MADLTKQRTRKILGNILQDERRANREDSDLRRAEGGRPRRRPANRWSDDKRITAAE